MSHAELVKQVRADMASTDLSQARAADMAAYLNISESTLRRRLAQAGTSYQALLDEERLRRCREQLAADPATDAAEMAYQLGYTEKNAFLRAFKRWTGQGYGEVKQ